MQRHLILLAAAALLSCATAREHWGDDEEEDKTSAAAQPRPADETAAPAATPATKAPSSFVLAPADATTAAPDNAPSSSSTYSGHGVRVIVGLTENTTGEESKRLRGEGIALNDAKPKTIDMTDGAAPATAPPPANPDKDKDTGKHKKKKKKKKGQKDDEVKPADNAPPPSQGFVTDAAPQPHTMDPFKKLDSDLASAGEKPTPAETTPEGGEVKAADADETKPSAPTRDPGSTGISVLVGVGAFISHNAAEKFGAALAYGGQIAWNPSVVGDFAFEVGYWHAGETTGDSFSTVSAAQNLVSAGVLYLPRFGPGLYAGAGLRAIIELDTAHYALSGSPPGDAGSAPIVGGDAAVVFGYRVSHFEARIEGRMIVSGAARLDFLPVGTVGATF